MSLAASEFAAAPAAALCCSSRVIRATAPIIAIACSKGGLLAVAVLRALMQAISAAPATAAAGAAAATATGAAAAAATEAAATAAATTATGAAAAATGAAAATAATAAAATAAAATATGAAAGGAAAGGKATLLGVYKKAMLSLLHLCLQEQATDPRGVNGLSLFAAAPALPLALQLNELREEILRDAKHQQLFMLYLIVMLKVRGSATFKHYCIILLYYVQ